MYISGTTALPPQEGDCLFLIKHAGEDFYNN
jgi:hypothetical protein